MNSYLRHCQENGKDSNIYGSDRSGNYSETPGKYTQRKRKKYVPFYAHALQYTIELRTPGIMTTISSFSVPLVLCSPHVLLPSPPLLSLPPSLYHFLRNQLNKSVILHVAVLLDVLTRCQENSSRTYSLGFGTEPTSMSRMHTYVGV